MKVLFVLALVCCTQLFGDAETKIVCNNRVLSRMNGKAITLMDVTKKMDLLIVQYYPEKFSDIAFRYQFYMNRWREILTDMIHKELLLKSAEEYSIPCSAGDVRQEMEEVFGPNIIAALDEANLSYDEAFQMLQSDIITRRVLYWQVHSRVLAEITPKQVFESYDAYKAFQQNQKNYSYQMLSFRSPDSTQTMEVAQVAHKYVTQEAVALDKLQEKMQSLLDQKGISFSISELFTQTQGEIAESVFSALASLEPSTYSAPLVQATRSSTAPLVRIYYLKDKKEEKIQSFEEVAQQLKDEIIKTKTQEALDSYFANLRKRYNVKLDEIAQNLPLDFEPFAVQ